MVEPSEDIIEGLKAKYGDVWIIRTSVVTVVVRQPAQFEFDAFTAMVMDEKQRAGASKVLLNTCMVWPPKAEFASQLKLRPGVIVPIQKKLVELAGVEEEAVVEKP